MMINGDWTFRLLGDYEPDFEWAAAPLPVFDDVEEGSTVGQSSYLCIPKSCSEDKVDAAYKFMNSTPHRTKVRRFIASFGDVPLTPPMPPWKCTRKA